MTGFDVHAAGRPSVRLWRGSADSGRSRDRGQTAQLIGLRMSLKPIDL
jgi:hypothetical protein